MEPSRSRTDLWLPACLALVLVHLLALAPHLVYPDLNLDYPFLGGDAYDWIANGLFLAGHDVRYSGRPPLLPLGIALMDRLAVLEWLPVLLQILSGISLLIVFLALRRPYGGRVAFTTAAVLLVNYSFQSLSLEVMADVTAAGLLFAAVALVAYAGERPALYPLAGLAAGASYLAQQTALLLVPAVGLFVLLRRRGHLRRPEAWLGAGVFALFPLTWTLVRGLALGQWGDTLVRQWGLLRLHGGSAGSYLWAAASLFGVPLLAAVTAGAVVTLTRPAAARRPAVDLPLLALLVCVAVGVFFVFLYDFEDKRFLLYLFFPGAVLAAEALSRLRPAPLYWSLALLVAAGSWFPHSVRGGDPREIPLWPLPARYLRAEVETRSSGAVRALPATARLVAGGESPCALTPYARVRRPRPEPPPRPDPAAFAADRGAVLLHAPGEAAGRYRTTGRLGNALRKRVKFLPYGFFGPQWSLLEGERLGPLFGHRARRVRVPGVDGTWLVLFDPPAPATGSCPAPPPVATLEAARNVAALAGRLRLPVAVLAGGPPVCDSLRLYLPFLVATPELYVLDRLPAAAVIRERRALGAARAVVAEIDGFRAVIVEEP